MFLDPTKCKFKTKKVKYLGLILTTEGLEMDPKKFAGVLEWQVPRTVKDVQSFLGFCNFYRRFIKGFSYIAKPLTELTKKDGNGKDQRHQFPLPHDGSAIRSFNKLKQAFSTAGVLAHFDADFVTAAVLSQRDADGVLRPVAFLSHKMSPAECNYEIYDKELLAIVKAFEEWRFELSGTEDPIQVLSDHQALQTFMTSKRLNRRQARWAEFLAEFNFKIKYRPGKQGTKPDALTRRPGDVPDSPNDDRRQHQVQVVIKPDQVDPEARIATITTPRDGGTRHALYLVHLYSCNSDVATPMQLAQMMYQLSEEDSVSHDYAEAALMIAALEGGEDAETTNDNDDDAGNATPEETETPVLTEDELVRLIKTA
jgi:hypothetical protein